MQEDVDEGVRLEDVLEDDAHAPVVPGQEEMHQRKRVTRAPVAGENENGVRLRERRRVRRTDHGDLESETAVTRPEDHSERPGQEGLVGGDPALSLFPTDKG